MRHQVLEETVKTLSHNCYSDSNLLFESSKEMIIGAARATRMSKDVVNAYQKEAIGDLAQALGSRAPGLELFG